MQAILILAHTAPDHVIRLSRLLKESFEVYVHFDKKTVLSDEHKQQLKNSNINFYSEIDVRWGGFSIADAAIFLMQQALKNPDITHFHVISGQCWPTKSVNEIYDFYQNNNKIYMENYKADGVKKSGEPIILWQKYYFNYDKINRRTTFGKIYHRLIFAIQSLLRINKFKRLNFDLEIYHGANWMDLPRDCVEYLLDYFFKNKNVQKVFKSGFCPDEFWAQTILCNSPFKHRIVSDIHRYIVWEHRHNSYPAILDQSDLEKIKSGDYHFCRKVVPNISEELIQELSNNI